MGFLSTGCSNNNYDQQDSSSSDITNEADGENKASNKEEDTKETEEKEGETSFTFSASTNHTNRFTTHSCFLE